MRPVVRSTAPIESRLMSWVDSCPEASPQVGALPSSGTFTDIVSKPPWYHAVFVGPLKPIDGSPAAWPMLLGGVEMPYVAPPVVPPVPGSGDGAVDGDGDGDGLPPVPPSTGLPAQDVGLKVTDDGMPVES